MYCIIIILILRQDVLCVQEMEYRQLQQDLNTWHQEFWTKHNDHFNQVDFCAASEAAVHINSYTILQGLGMILPDLGQNLTDKQDLTRSCMMLFEVPARSCQVLAKILPSFLTWEAAAK